MVDSKNIAPPIPSPEWTPEEEQAAAILAEMLEAMSEIFTPSPEEPDEFINKSVAGCLYTRFGESISIQVKVKDLEGTLKSEFNFRKEVIEGKEPLLYVDKMDAKLGVGVVPIEESDLPDLIDVQAKLTEMLVQLKAQQNPS